MTTETDLRRLRIGTQSVATLALRDLDRLLRSADVQAVQALNDVLPSLIQTYGSVAATLAADWYDDVRDAAGTRRRFTAIPADIPNVGVPALIGWASSTATTDDTFRSLLSGGVQRRIVNFSRDTVTGSAIADPDAQGWQRQTDGDACAFCEMLAGRGTVYTESAADFASHDDCGCQAVPAFTGQPRPVKPYTPSDRNITDADRARVREWIASH